MRRIIIELIVAVITIVIAALMIHYLWFSSPFIEVKFQHTGESKMFTEIVVLLILMIIASVFSRFPSIHSSHSRER